MSRVQTDKSTKWFQGPIAWVIALCTLGYMLPWAIAATRGKSNTGAIGWLNLLAGWTILGWWIALFMAFGTHQVVPQTVIVQQMTPVPPQAALPAAVTPVTPDVAAGWYPQADGTQRYWDGTAWTDHIAAQPEQA